MADTSDRMIEKLPPVLFIQGHLGCGDHLITNAIYRHAAQAHDLIIPVKRTNIQTVKWMLRGMRAVILAVDGDEEMKRLAAVAEKRGSILKLGMFGKNFDEKRWDKVFFEQAGVPFEDRWNKFDVDRDLAREFKPPAEPYAFIHQDIKRGFCLDYCRLPKHLHLVEPEVGKTENIFQYCRLIEEAAELHCIDSCFAILADSLTTLKARRKVIHLYARPGALPPTYQPGWEILK